jgi:hypothetical protein
MGEGLIEALKLPFFSENHFLKCCCMSKYAFEYYSVIKYYLLITLQVRYENLEWEKLIEWSDTT